MPQATEPTPAAFIAQALSNPVNAELLQRLDCLRLPQWHLTAGGLFQAVWNRQAGRAPGWGVHDHDVFLLRPWLRTVPAAEKGSP